METYLNSCVACIREFLHSVREFQDVLNEARTHRRSDFSVRIHYIAAGAGGFVTLLTGLYYINSSPFIFGSLMITSGGIAAAAYTLKRKCDTASLENTTGVSVEGIAKIEAQSASCLDRLGLRMGLLVGVDVDSLSTDVNNFSQAMKPILGIHHTWKELRNQNNSEQ